jgi:hypothetical protein
MKFPKPVKKKKIRKRIPRISVQRGVELARYSLLREMFLKRLPFCYVCIRRDMKPKPSKDVHHLRGRAGSLFMDSTYWMPVCRTCHDWIGANPIKARAIGCLCQAGEWNKPQAQK